MLQSTPVCSSAVVDATVAVLQSIPCSIVDATVAQSKPAVVIYVMDVNTCLH